MKTSDFITEDIVNDAHEMHQDHEVQMARADCYNAAKYAIELHKLLKNISEQEGLEGWVSEKITLANDYLRTVTEYLRYEQQAGVSDIPEFDPVSATKTLDSVLGEDIQEGKPGLWDNIHAKRERIKHGSGEKMRKPGSKGAPTPQAFKDAAKEDVDVSEELKMKHQNQHYGTTQRRPDNSKSLAKRSFHLADQPNVPKTDDGFPTVQYRHHGKAGHTRIDPTKAQTTVKKKETEKTIPNFLKKDTTEDLNEFASAGASSSAGIATAPTSGKNAGTLFGGSYKQPSATKRKKK